VIAADIDPWTEAAVRLNAAENGVLLEFVSGDLVGSDVEADVILAGDVFYDRAFADRLIPWFIMLAGQGKLVLVGDPGRAYLPKDRLEERAVYQVPVTRALEDSEIKKTTVWRFLAG
jgi:predicted nicotinamide N-methyase